MNINHIFNLFNSQSEDDDTSLLIDFSEHPLYWIGGFNKIIRNHLFFKNHAIQMFKDASKELDVDEIEQVGEDMMFNKAWEYIRHIKLDNTFHAECLRGRISLEFYGNLKLTINHFEKLEEYEKCALLKDIEIYIKGFLI
jgi:hypothetical protein